MAKKVIRSDIRVNKYISDSGFCSRREADKMIADERVTINGELATLGSRVAEGDKVKIDGEPLHFILWNRESINCAVTVLLVKRNYRELKIPRLKRSNEGAERDLPVDRRNFVRIVVPKIRW